MIRKYVDGDFESVMNLFSQLWDHKEVNATKIKTIFDEDPSKTICILEIQNRIVAVSVYSIRYHLWAEAKVLEIEALVVDSSCRNCGYGKQLLVHIESIGRMEQCSFIELNSAFRRESAHLFYERNGYEKCAFVFDKDLR